MSLSLLIEYKDPARNTSYCPFTFQRVLIQYWWPLAKKLGLEMLQHLEWLSLTEREDAEQLLAEFRVVQRHLQQPDQSDVPPFEVPGMLRQLDDILPDIERAIAEWDQVKQLIM